MSLQGSQERPYSEDLSCMSLFLLSFFNGYFEILNILKGIKRCGLVGAGESILGNTYLETGEDLQI